MSDIIPATNEEVEKWKTEFRLSDPNVMDFPASYAERLVARIELDKKLYGQLEKANSPDEMWAVFYSLEHRWRRK